MKGKHRTSWEWCFRTHGARARGGRSTSTHVLDRTTDGLSHKSRQSGAAGWRGGVREHAVLARNHQGPCWAAVCVCVCTREGGLALLISALHTPSWGGTCNCPVHLLIAPQTTPPGFSWTWEGCPLLVPSATSKDKALWRSWALSPHQDSELFLGKKCISTCSHSVLGTGAFQKHHLSPG